MYVTAERAFGIIFRVGVNWEGGVVVWLQCYFAVEYGLVYAFCMNTVYFVSISSCLCRFIPSFPLFRLCIWFIFLFLPHCSVSHSHSLFELYFFHCFLSLFLFFSSGSDRCEVGNAQYPPGDPCGTRGSGPSVNIPLTPLHSPLFSVLILLCVWVCVLFYVVVPCFFVCFCFLCCWMREMIFFSDSIRIFFIVFFLCGCGCGCSLFFP